MSKVSNKFGGKLHKDEYDRDDLPSGLIPTSASRYDRDVHRNSTSFLTHLRGLLRKNIGRPWSKVTPILAKVKQECEYPGWTLTNWLRWEVSQNLYEDAQGVVRPIEGRSRWMGSEGRHAPVTGFYVHPRTKLLCWKPEPPRNRREAALRQKARHLHDFGFRSHDKRGYERPLNDAELANYVIGEMYPKTTVVGTHGQPTIEWFATVYAKEDGIWYVYDVVKHDPNEVICINHPTLTGPLQVCRKRSINDRERMLVDKTKRQANKKDIKIIKGLL